MPDAELWAKQIKDQIADSSKVRDGLNDDEAIPLIDWGNQQAHKLAEKMVTPDTPEPTTEAVDTKGYDLVRLMTRITWLATYRHKKDALWLTQTFKALNQINQSLHGPNAPTFSDDDINAWIVTHKQYSNSDLIQNLMTHLTPLASEPSTPPAATLTSSLLPAQPTPPANAPVAPTTLTSDLLPTQPTPPTADPAAPNTTDLVQNMIQRMKAKKSGDSAAPPPQGEKNGS